MDHRAGPGCGRPPSVANPDGPYFELLTTIEAIVEGNWVGDWPQELIDSELCEAYHWSWPELQQTPEYVRRVFFMTQMIKNKKQADDVKDAERRQSNAGMASWGP